MNKGCEFINLCKICQKKIGLSCNRSIKPIDKKKYLLDFTIKELIEKLEYEYHDIELDDNWRAIKLRIGIY